MDRASAFADDETVELLRARFVCVGVSLTELGKSRDAEGDFFRKITAQRAEPAHSKQGFYIASPDGTLIHGWMYPRPDDGAMKRHLKEALASYRPLRKVDALDGSKVDRQCNPQPPAGALVADVRSKLLRADWPKTNVERFKIIRGAVGTDRLWILKDEAEALVRGMLPDSLLERIIRFHLVDNTRGVPGRWKQEHIKEVTANRVRLADGEARRFNAAFVFRVEAKEGRLTRFDFVARGEHVETKPEVGEAPNGAATLAVAIALAPADEWNRVVPLYMWDSADYLRTSNLRVTELRK